MFQRRRLIAGLAISALTACSAAVGSGVPADELETATARLRPEITDGELADLIEACLAENAVTAFTRQADNTFTADRASPSDDAVMSECRSEITSQFPPSPGPVSEAEYGALYERYLVMAECVEGLGYAVDPPTFDTYMDTSGEWFPYADVPEGLSFEEWTQLNTQCPQDPWAPTYDGSP